MTIHRLCAVFVVLSIFTAVAESFANSTKPQIVTTNNVFSPPAGNPPTNQVFRLPFSAMVRVKKETIRGALVALPEGILALPWVPKIFPVFLFDEGIADGEVVHCEVAPFLGVFNPPDEGEVVTNACVGVALKKIHKVRTTESLIKTPPRVFIGDDVKVETEKFPLAYMARTHHETAGDERRFVLEPISPSALHLVVTICMDEPIVEGDKISCTMQTDVHTWFQIDGRMTVRRYLNVKIQKIR